MASRWFILISLVACVCIASCYADETESSSSAEAQSSTNETSAKSDAASKSEAESSTNETSAKSDAASNSGATSPKKKKCRKVKKCGINEEFSYCIQTIGRAQYCSQNGLSIASRGECSSCKEGCVCKEDYLRNANGTCIHARQCEANCGPTEVLDDCPVDCASDYCPISVADSGLSCSRPNKDECPNPVCKCRLNYRRADNGTCIPTKNCPSFDCSAKPNEEYNPCPLICPSDECGLPRLNGKCPFIIGTINNCTPKCQCKDGYARSNGTCVSFEKCPGICPVNEEYSSCTQGGCRAQNCSNRNDPEVCRKIAASSCNKGCICKENYYRNKNGTCVTKDQCEADLCPENEEYSACTQGGCRPQNCSDRNGPEVCRNILASACKKGCICKENYYRNENGTCVMGDQCDAKPCSRCPSNEEYVPCIQGVCRAMNCSQRGDNVPCPDRAWPPEQCDAGCICKENYLRTANGICVSEDQCDS